MRKFTRILGIGLLTFGLSFSIAFAQSPEKMSYQAVIRDAGNTLVTNQSVGMQISILQGGSNGAMVYVETQTITSNTNGLVSLEIGNGASPDDFSAIDWGNGPYFIKTETDPVGGTNYTITGTTQMMSVPYALYAKTAENVANDQVLDSVGVTALGFVAANSYAIGDFAQGGIVFWVDETGKHGLVCVKSDQDGGAGIRWHAGTSGNTQAKSRGVYGGKTNTAIIIAAHVAIGDDGATYAARICNELQITEGGKTYGDWYLPSRDELNLMFTNRGFINTTATSNGGSIILALRYWNSTEFTGGNAGFTQFTAGGSSGSISKAVANRVRAVRDF